MKRSRGFGISAVFLSAVVFGFTPVLANLSYAGGNNGVNMALLRAVLPLPLLFLLCHLTSPGYHASAKQLRRGAVLGMLNFGCTLMLYSSYSHIPVGIATTLHFLYPLFVLLFRLVWYHERSGSLKWLGLFMSMGGAMLLVEMGEGGLSPFGMALALGSGVVFAAYIILLDKEAGEPLPLYRLMTTTSLAGAVLCALVGGVTGSLTLALTPQAWLFAAAAALMVVGDADAAVYSLLEPLTSIVFGLILLGETFTIRKGVSCALILLGLLVTALADKHRNA